MACCQDTPAAVPCSSPDTTQEITRGRGRGGNLLFPEDTLRRLAAVDGEVRELLLGRDEEILMVLLRMQESWTTEER